MKHVPLRLALSLACLLLPALAQAQWTLTGTPVAAATGSQQNPTLAPDGSGGAILAWDDDRDGTNRAYVQRLDAQGLPQWTANGLQLCATASGQAAPQVASDGAGGAIVAWLDVRAGNYDVYAQRVNAVGQPLWTANGVALCTAAGEQSSARIIPDGSGGAVVAWQDARSGNYDIYAQRVDASGVALWTANGTRLCGSENDQLNPAIAAGDSGGAVVVWQDRRYGTDYDIWGQRVNGSGVNRWTSDGVNLCIAAEDQVLPQVAPDGAGGVIAVWEDFRNFDKDIYARRVIKAGGQRWGDGTGGIPICSAASTQERPVLAADGVGGAIIAWHDFRSGGIDIYAQRVNDLGAAQWPTNGTVVCGAGFEQSYPAIVADGAGGAVIAWQDARNGAAYDVYAQRVGASGSGQWTNNGVVLGTGPNAQYLPRIVADGLGGAIVAWNDDRAVAYVEDVYAQRIQALGYWGHPEPVLATVSDVPLDQGGRVQATWKASGRADVITQYSLWREVPAASGGAASAWTGDGDARFRTAPGPHGAATTWEFIVTVPARSAEQYGYMAPTPSDSMAGNPAERTYQVLAHTSDPFVFFESNLVSGHSVDNLSPGAPPALSAQRVGGDVHLRWSAVTDADLRDYVVYRATSSGVTPVPANRLAAASDTVLIDANAPGGTLYYVVTAFDVHGNQGPPSAEAQVGATAAVEDRAAVAALAVLPNQPNPFAGVTQFRIGLPSRSDVEVDVYDPAGRRVGRRFLGSLPAGWHSVAFEARDEHARPLASGVYTYRVRAAGAVATSRFVVVQ